MRAVHPMMPSLSELLTLLAFALALRCVYGIAAPMADMAHSLNKIQSYLLDRNEYAHKTLTQLKAHHNSMPIIPTPRRKKQPKASISAADTL